MEIPDASMLKPIRDIVSSMLNAPTRDAHISFLRDQVQSLDFRIGDATIQLTNLHNFVLKLQSDNEQLERENKQLKSQLADFHKQSERPDANEMNVLRFFFNVNRDLSAAELAMILGVSVGVAMVHIEELRSRKLIINTIAEGGRGMPAEYGLTAAGRKMAATA